MPGEMGRRKKSQNKLWSRGGRTLPEVEAFTAGEDYVLDLELVEYDCVASIAHAKMLAHIGILKQGEARRLTDELNAIRRLHQQGRFAIQPEQEDVHTAIEQHLTRKLGSLGKKIHTARSRNDQVLAALRLYYKDRLQALRGRIDSLMRAFDGFNRGFGRQKFPGYTHTRKAMPTTFGIWSNAYRDAMRDNLILLHAVHKLIDQSPLGTGAGYGVPLRIDRNFTARMLGFGRVQRNPIYTQHSRGKFEAMLLHVCCQVLFDLNRCAGDIIFYSMPEIGYVQLPGSLTTGSSIMPQKKNPDVLELVRANYHTVVGQIVQVQSVVSNLISGYHRDVQVTKEPVMKGLTITINSLAIMEVVFKHLSVDGVRCNAALTEDMFATEEVYALVERGVPFRDAYRRIAKKYT
jgi:argininosuccinate lyase